MILAAVQIEVSQQNRPCDSPVTHFIPPAGMFLTGVYMFVLTGVIRLKWRVERSASSANTCYSEKGWNQGLN